MYIYKYIVYIWKGRMTDICDLLAYLQIKLDSLGALMTFAKNLLLDFEHLFVMGFGFNKVL